MSIITSYNYLHLVMLPNSPLSPNKNKVKTPGSHCWPLLSQWRRRWDPDLTLTRGKTPVTKAALSSAAGKRRFVSSTCWAGLTVLPSPGSHKDSAEGHLTGSLHTHSSSLPKDHSLSFPGLGQESPGSTSGAWPEGSQSPTHMPECSAVGWCVLPHHHPIHLVLISSSCSSPSPSSSPVPSHLSLVSTVTNTTEMLL